MASVILKRETWYLKYKDEFGRRAMVASKAKTKGDARRMADDLERKAERIRCGLEQPSAPQDQRSFGDLVEWWLENYWKARPSYAKTKSRAKCHLLTAPFAAKPAIAVTAGEIERHLDGKLVTVGPKGKPLGPQALNHLREDIRKAYQAGIKEKLFRVQNPVDEVKQWRVPKRKPDFLRVHEVADVLNAVRPNRWKPMFMTALYTGLRKGELFGLRKSDVHFELGPNGQIHVQRSYDHDTTKGGHEESIPIAVELRPWIEKAVAESPSELVFPMPDGSMYPEKTNLCSVLRRALRRAGIILGYRHKCRAKACAYVEAAAEQTIRRCPKHKHAMWVTAVVRPIRFHDMRHTTGSLLAMSGVPMHAIQKVLRHSDIQTTTDIYAHLDPGYLQDTIDKLRFDTSVPEVPEAEQDVAELETAARTVATESNQVGTRLVPDTFEVPSDHPLPGEGTAGVQGVSVGAGYQGRTGDIQLGKLTLYQLS